MHSRRLIELVEKIRGPATETEAEKMLWVITFQFNCRHPGGSDLIFYPAEHFGGRIDPTPEEIVEKALQGE